MILEQVSNCRRAGGSNPIASSSGMEKALLEEKYPQFQEDSIPALAMCILHVYNYIVYT